MILTFVLKNALKIADTGVQIIDCERRGYLST